MPDEIVQAPSILHPPSPFLLPPSPSSAQPSAARLYDNGQFAWLAREGSVHVVKAGIGERVALLRLAERGSELKVTCSCELSPNSADTAGNASLLVLAVAPAERKSVVVVLNTATSRLIRAIEIPWKVSSVCAVSSGSLQSPSLFIQSILQLFAGSIAVGCVGGHVLLVDLALDITESRELSQASLNEPRSLVFLESVHSSTISARVKQARDAAKHVCFNITGTANLCIPVFQAHLFSTFASKVIPRSSTV